MLYVLNTRWYNGANLHKDTSVESDELRNHHEPISGRGERRWASYIGQLWLVLARRRGRKRKGRRMPTASPGQHLPRASSSSRQQPQGCLASAAASALGPRCSPACLPSFPLTHTCSAIFPPQPASILIWFKSPSLSSSSKFQLHQTISPPSSNRLSLASQLNIVYLFVYCSGIVLAGKSISKCQDQNELCPYKMVIKVARDPINNITMGTFNCGQPSSMLGQVNIWRSHHGNDKNPLLSTSLSAE